MSLNNFIPTFWSTQILSNLNHALVIGQPGVINRDYEGEIRNAGDTVKISSIGRVTIGSYTKNVDISDPETLTDATRSLLINQAKYFNFQVDDVDRAQQQPKVMGEAMREAAYGLANTADGFLAAKYSDGTTATITDATPTAAEGTAYENLVDLRVALDEVDCPPFGRWAIIPPWYYGLLLKDDRFVASGAGPDATVLRNGIVGEAAGIRILVSNNIVTTGSDDSIYHILAGHPMAWSYAEQVNSVEAYRPQKRFADAVKGLHLYGAKVVRPTLLQTAAVTKP